MRSAYRVRPADDYQPDPDAGEHIRAWLEGRHRFNEGGSNDHPGQQRIATVGCQAPVRRLRKERFCTLIAHGATVEHAMRIIGFSMAVVYRHLHADELFATAYTHAQAAKRSKRGDQLYLGFRLSAKDSARLLELAEEHDNPVDAELRAAVGAHLLRAKLSSGVTTK